MRRISEFVQHEAYVGAGEDSHGNQVETWATPVKLGIYAFAPGTSTESFIPGQDRVITAPTLYIPTDKKVSHRDRITVSGELNRFEVDGEIRPFRNPYDSSMNGVTINLKAVSG